MARFASTLALSQLVTLLAIACSTTANTSDKPTSTAPPVPRVNPISTATTEPVDNNPYPAGTVGYSISWPQCGGPYPDEPFDFGIIGVTDGRTFTRNPCFAEEYRWAQRGRFHPSIYMNLNYRAAKSDFSVWWSCEDSDASCRAFRYGWAAADDAYTYATSFGPVAPVWWLDVQTISDWSAEPALNAESIRGAADYLESKGIRVGISSTSYQWGTVAGDAQHNMPVWDASATDADEAAAFCSQGKDFAGGRTEQIAYIAGSFEVVRACGGGP